MLLLEVVSRHASSLGRNSRRAVAEGGLRIGREGTNDWVLPQDYVSRQQAIIRNVNGLYFLEQLGNCPLAVNDPARPLERNRIVRLSPGDRIFIDDIEIVVSEATSASEAVVHASETNRPPHGSLADLALGQIGEPLGEPRFGGSAADDPLAILGRGDPVSAGDTGERQVQIDPGTWLDEPLTVEPRPNQAHASSLSDNWWDRPAAGAAVKPSPGQHSRSGHPSVAVRGAGGSAQPSVGNAQSQPPPDAGGTLAGLLQGAGLDPGQAMMSPEVAAQLGAVLRIVVEGTMQVLAARNEIRREFRVPVTQVARKDNNPLKFSADATDALHKLLVQRSPAYLDTVSAFEDAFADIRHHQLAMLDSLQVAFEHMLEAFDPESLEKQFAKRGGQASVLGIGNRAKTWEAYVQRYRELQNDRDHAFRQLFGDEFAKAYEQQLQRHKLTSRAEKRGR